MPSSLTRVFIVAALAMPLTGRAQGLAPRGQAVPVAPMAQPGMGYLPQEPRMSVVDPDKKLSAGDQVTVEIVEDREGGLPRMVTATGELDVPPLGRVKVSGKTAAEAAGSIKVLLEKDYYYTATVRLSIDRVSPVQVQMGTVQITGQVRMQGPVQIIAGEPLTLTAAVFRAGGIGEWGNQRKVRLTRQRNGKAETEEFDFKKIVDSGDVKLDPVLQDGDRINVPKVGIRF